MMVGLSFSKPLLRHPQEYGYYGFLIISYFFAIGSNVFYMKCRCLEDCCYGLKLKDERQR